jgi:aspartate/tyrosine/aromatic aminotransferase
MFFQNVLDAPPDPIFGLSEAFKADPRKEKINLVVGIYKDDQMKAELFPVVRKAKNDILNLDILADYLPIDGSAEFLQALGPLVFGESLWKDQHAQIYAAQTVGGTGALRIGAEFINQEISKSFFVSNHTWPNHRSILERAGCKHENYPYYNRAKKGFDFEAMLAFLKTLPPKSVVVLHACCHNPTGSDPTIEEWRLIAKAMKEHQLFPFFDFAYQGLGMGLEKDAEAVRLFAKEGLEILIAYSCSKNFSMYCQRVGALFIVTKTPVEKERIKNQIRRIIRALYSNPPAHGAQIVLEILKKEEHKKLWTQDLGTIRTRIQKMREMLIQKLFQKAGDVDWSYLKEHKGMFSFIDMDKAQVQRMIKEFAIYMTDNGRISIPGLTTQNIDSVVNALSKCVKQ